MSTISPHAGLLGSQRPRILHLPPSVGSPAADEAIELGEIAGIFLDDWQKFAVRCALAEAANGNWATFEYVLCVARQNGKNEIILVLELAGLFLFASVRLIVHTAHRADTAFEAFRRLREAIERTPDLLRKVKPRGIVTGNGKEGVELLDGSRIRFRTRSKGGGRGWTGDWTIIDEGMDVPEEDVGALLPAMSARPNPLVLYAASAADYLTMDNCYVLTAIRDRALAGTASALAYLEWSPDLKPEEAEAVADDPELWAEGNPALGGRMRVQHVEREFDAMPIRQFIVERLNVGFWPNLDALAGVPISPTVFKSRTDVMSEIVGPVAFAIDASPDQASTAIGVAGVRADGRRHVEVVAHRPGTNWVIGALEVLLDLHEHVPGVAVDLGGPAGSLATSLAKAEIEVEPVTAQEHAQACGRFSRGITDDEVRHLGTPELVDAVKGSQKRALGEGWAWSRKSSKTDISPLVAVTLADFHFERAPAPEEPVDVLDLVL